MDIHSPDTTTRVELPLFLASVEAGFPSPARDDLEKKLDLNDLLIQHPAATFFVRAAGHSMQGAGIHDGDLLIVDRAVKPEDGKVVIAVINGEFTVKRIKIQKGKLWLMPENPSFAPIKVDTLADFQVWGVVTYVIHRT